MNRRGFLAALAALPFVPKAALPAVPSTSEVYITSEGLTLIEYARSRSMDENIKALTRKFEHDLFYGDPVLRGLKFMEVEPYAQFRS